MEAGKSRLTLPEMARALGIGRATAERLASQYYDRLPPCERVGITRIWPAEALEILRTIHAMETRCNSNPF